MEKLQPYLNVAWDSGIEIGKNILAAILIFIVGRLLISFIKKIVTKALNKRQNMDEGIKSFVKSLVNVTLTVLLLIAVVGALGVETTSFAALLASAGVAVGMALSGNLQNFAGGVMILLFKPIKTGDYIEAQGQAGSVKEIQIFHTVLTTPDNQTIFIPNGPLSSNVIKNYSTQDLRRVDWSFGVDYGTDYEKVKAVIEKLIAADSRILKDPAHFIALGELADSSVNITVRAWVKSADYLGVFFDMNKIVYETFNKEGIEFPFPQLTVHTAK
jgi:small conductance mechanosensitive channel